MNKPSFDKESVCRLLVETFPHFTYEELVLRNEAQIYTLYHACLDENGKLPNSAKDKK